MSEVRVPIDNVDIPSDCEIYEIFVDGKSVGFLVVGPDGTEYPAETLEHALGIIEEIKRNPPKLGC